MAPTEDIELQGDCRPHTPVVRSLSSCIEPQPLDGAEANHQQSEAEVNRQQSEAEANH